MKMYLPKIHPTTFLYIGCCFYLQWYKESLMLLGIILFHEYAHFIVAKVFHYDVDGITLYPFGAFLNINNYGTHEIWQDLGVAIAGACSHPFLLLLGYLLQDVMGYHMYCYFVQFNFQVLFFNLLPIYPMDGSKILLCFLSCFIDYLTCLKIILVISHISLVLLMVYFQQTSYLYIFIFLLFQIIQFSQNFYYEYLLLLMCRKENKKRKPILHDGEDFIKNRQNYYRYHGRILDEKSFIKSRIFIDKASQ